MRRIFTAALSLLASRKPRTAAELAPPAPPATAAPRRPTGLDRLLRPGSASPMTLSARAAAPSASPDLGFRAFATSLQGVVGWSRITTGGPGPLGAQARSELRGRRAQRQPVRRTSAPRCGGAVGGKLRAALPPGSERCGREAAMRWGTWLFYATGGGALGQVDTNATAAVGSFVATDNRSPTGNGWSLSAAASKW